MSELTQALGPDLVSTDGAVLEAVVGELLRARGWWVAFAESCTGGLATSRMTDIPGSSDYVERSVVAYSNRAKIELLDVPESLIAEHGAVSEPVALAMAAGIRKRAGVQCRRRHHRHCRARRRQRAEAGRARCASRSTVATSKVRTFRFPGGREMVKAMSANWAIDMLRRAIPDQAAQMRVFVAVDVGDAVRREVTRVVSALTGKLEAVKTPPKVVWVKPAALHVTIRFIGEVEPPDVERLQELLAAADRRGAVRARVARHRHVSRRRNIRARCGSA